MTSEELNNWVRAQGYRPIHNFVMEGWDACVAEAEDGSCKLAVNGPHFAEPEEARKYLARLKLWGENTLTALALLGLAEDK